MASTSDSDASPIVTRDPRFKAGRSLVQKGMAHGGAIEIFSSLVEEGIQIDSSSCFSLPFLSL